MSSRWFWAAVLSFGLIFTLGCNRLHWGEQEAKPSGASTQLGSEVRCLSNVLPVMKDFIQGQAQAIQVSKTWQCFGGALQLFKNRVRGESPRGYRAEELKEFFQDYFLKEGVEISPALLTEIMRIKQVFVGGENQMVTRAELDDLIQFSTEMESHSLELLPSMKILSSRWTPAPPVDGETNESEFELAKIRAETVLSKLAARIESRGTSYEMKNFVRLLEELQGLYQTEWAFVLSLKRALPVFQKLKKSLMGTQENLILANEWSRFGLLGMRSYMLYLRYQYFVKMNPKEPDSGPNYRVVFKSLDDLLVTAGEFIAAKPGARLEVSEVQEILDQAQTVFPNLKISLELLPELMKVKQALVGGSRSEFSGVDFQTARNKLASLRSLSGLYQKWARVFGGKWDPSTQPRPSAVQEFLQAELDLIRLTSSLGANFEASYDLRDILKLVKAFEVSFPTPEGASSLSEKVDQYLEAGVALKSLALNDWSPGKRKNLGSANSLVTREQWLPLLARAGEIYGRYLFYNYFLKGKDWRWDSGPEDTQLFLEGLKLPLQNILVTRGAGASAPIKVSELTVVYGELQKSGLIKFSWSSSVISGLVDRALRRFLTAPTDRLQGRMQTELSDKALAQFFSEAEQFLILQARLSQLTAAQPVWEQASLRDALKGTEFERLLQGSASFGLDQQGRIFISPKSTRAYDRNSLFRLNWVRVLVRLVIRGYAESADRVDSMNSLSENEVQKIFTDFKPIAVELKLIDPSNDRFARNRFLEANLFMPTSDGDQSLEYREAAWLVSYIVSGIQMHSSLSGKYTKSCGGSQSVEVDCALRVVQQNVSSEFAAMPQMSKYLNNIDPLPRREMVRDLMTAAGWSDTSRRVQMTELALVPHIVQYIESIMRRFDSDDSGALTMAEALRSEPLFRGLLARVSGFDDPQWLRALFAYILVYGKAPEGVADELFFVSDWVNRTEYPINADRRQLARILAFITERARQPQPEGQRR